MTPELFNRIAISPAMSLLPARMDTPHARAMMLAIALQESGLKARRQLPRGPARSYYQFEAGGGVHGVLTHHASRDIARDICRAFDYAADAATAHAAIEHNDILASIFARLLLYTLPYSLPGPGDAAGGWRQYTDAWRPGKERPDTWAGAFDQGWRFV